MAMTNVTAVMAVLCPITSMCATTASLFNSAVVMAIPTSDPTLRVTPSTPVLMPCGTASTIRLGIAV